MVIELPSTTPNELTQLYQSMVAQATDGMFCTTLDRIITYANPAFHKLVNQDDQSNLQGMMLDILIADASETVVTLAERVAMYGDWSGMLHFRRSNNTICLGQVSAFALRCTQGDLFGIGYTVRDGSIQQQTEEQVMQTLELTRAVVESATGGVLVTSLDNRVLTFNQRFVHLWQLPHAWDVHANANQHLALLMNLVDDPDSFKRRVFAILAVPEREAFDIILLRDGRVFSRHSTPYRVGQRISGRLWSYRDITEQHRTIEELRVSRTRLHAIFDNAAVGIALLDTNDAGRFQKVNQRLVELLGFSSRELCQFTLSTIILTDDQTAWHEHWQQFEQDDQTDLHMEARLVCQDSRIVWVDLTTRALYDGRGRIEAAIAVFNDITGRKLAAQSLQRRLVQLEALRQTMNEITAELELDPLLNAFLERALSLIGADSGQIAMYEPDCDELVILACMNMQAGLAGTRQSLDEHTSYVLHTRQPRVIVNDPIWKDRLPAYAHSGTQTLLLVPLLAGDHTLGLISIGDTHPERIFDKTDVEVMTLFAQQATIAIQNARLFSEVQRLAITDPLTSLHNRRSFFNLAHYAYDQATRYNHALSFLLLDIDYFKLVNDTFGHRVGDQVLQAVAERCVATLRSVDIVARYGGEEIVMMLPDTDQANVCHVASRLHQALAGVPIQTECGEVSITVSIGGVSYHHHHAISLEQLIDQADQALYQAKQSGRDQVMIMDIDTSCAMITIR